MTTFGATSIPIFSGENYDHWSIKMKTFFLSQDLWDVVEKKVTIPAERVSDSIQSKQESTKDARALFILQEAVSESIFPKLMRANTSKEAWETLHSEFQGNAKLVMTTVQHTEAITGMDPIIYKAAAQGNLEAFEQYDPISHPLDGFLTVNKNTILHICISSILVEEEVPATGGTGPALAANFVKDVLDKCPSLLLKANMEDDTPLHVAARYGHASIVKVLIEHQKSQHQDLESGVVEATKQMIGKLNKEGDTALHEAVRHNHIDVVKQLLMEVDIEFSFGANAAGETPLYLAAERHFPALVSEILNKFTSPAYDGPLGRTALHAATFSNDEGMSNKILERYGHLCKQADQNGWTPLHFAAYMGHIESTKLLLESDREVAYMKDADGRTALHIAAQGHRSYGVTKEIISKCPDCCEVVDNKGRNALHLALINGYLHTALLIQDNSSLRNLLNQKDRDGSTPLHHYCDSVAYEKRVLNSPRVDKMVFNKKNQNAFQILKSKIKSFPTDADQFFSIRYAKEYRHQRNSISARYHERVLNSPRVDKMVFNKENQNAYQILTTKSFPTDDDQFKKMKNFFEDREDYRVFYNGRVLEDGYADINMKEPKEEDVKLKEREKKMEEEDKAAQVHLVAAALITTVTFAAGINMPGGFIGGDDHPRLGSAVLEKSDAFKVFIITNALALMLSSSAVFIHLFIPLMPSEDLFKTRTRFLQLAFRFLLSSMAPMVLAFVTDLESGVVESTTKMIGKLNKERGTALHEAVLHDHIELVKQLLMEVDPEFSFGANAAGETPLYLAAERRFPDLVSEILNKLKSPAYDGPFGPLVERLCTLQHFGMMKE